MKVTTVDTHTEGQPTRIVVSGVGDLGGDTMAERCNEFRSRYDHMRVGLLAGPRGHPGLFGCVLVDPCDPSADFGAVFMHNDGYIDVSGHAAMGVITALVETGIVGADGDTARVALDTPAGVISCEAEVKNGKAGTTVFRTVPSWVGLQGASLQVPRCGEVIVDVAYGGNLLVSAWAEHLGVELTPHNMETVTAVAMAVKKAAADKLVVRSPETGERHEIGAVTVLDAPNSEPPALRMVQVYGPGVFDRSPGASAASARLALMFARGEIFAEDEVIVESSMTDGRFRAKVLEPERVGARTAVATEITGRAFVTGFHDFVFDPEDPLSVVFPVGSSGTMSA